MLSSVIWKVTGKIKSSHCTNIRPNFGSVFQLLQQYIHEILFSISVVSSEYLLMFADNVSIHVYEIVQEVPCEQV